MMSATATLTYCSAVKNVQMFNPNSTPSGAARRKSARLGQRRSTAAATSSTAVATHMRQNDSTTPPTPVALPSTPPNDQNAVAPSTASSPRERPRGEVDSAGIAADPSGTVRSAVR